MMKGGEKLYMVKEKEKSGLPISIAKREGRDFCLSYFT
jgi:hypothetical protein